MKILLKRSKLIIYDAHFFTTKQPRVNFNARFRRRTSHEPNRIHRILSSCEVRRLNQFETAD